MATLTSAQPPAPAADTGTGAGTGGGRPSRPRRSTRDMLVDLAVVLLCLTWGIVALGVAVTVPSTTDAAMWLGALTLLPASVAMWWRRRWPVPLAVVMVVVGSYLDSTAVPAMVAVFTVAVHRSTRAVVPLIALGVVAQVVYSVLRPDPTLTWWMFAAMTAVLFMAVAGWGTAVRHRRALLESWRERAQRAEAEQHLRVDQARQLERTRIAREMHDVLAHRISLISMHAGALEYRVDASPAQVTAAAGVVRETAHQALEDLRGVLGVLRSTEVAATASAGATSAAPLPCDAADVAVEPPQPSLADLPDLVAECRRAGARVRSDVHVPAGAPVPEQLGRTAYRVAQEGLTNARKHAPGSRVELCVSGAPGGELLVRVRNRVLGAAAAEAAQGARAGHGAAVPGSGTGLVGLSERVVLAGGRLAHGWRSGAFELEAALPWPAA